MQDLLTRIEQLKQSLMIDSKLERIHQLELAMQSSGFWDDTASATELSRELTSLKHTTDQWRHVADLVSAGTEADRTYIEEELGTLELATFLNGPHDGAAALLSVHAGTGGVDAMDWAEMLLKMYLKYAEARRFTTTTIDMTVGEEAGIKSACVRIAGDNAYGFLRGEAGVHRLVRMSPFNADHLRQTSFALVEVVPEITKTSLNIPETDLRIDTYRASGHGGQGVNTTDSAVRITHIPSGIVVTCQNERSQLQNKETAMRILESRLIKLMEETNETELSKLKPNVQSSWGNQIRSYVIQPYTLVKDHRTEVETADVQGVLDGDLERFIQAELTYQK